MGIMTPSRSLLVVLAVVGALTSGCGVLDFRDEREQELDDKLTRWLERGPVNYEYRLTQICFCPPDHTRPYLVRVLSGKISQTLDAATGAPPPSNYQSRTIIDLFNVVRVALERDPDRIDVVYDPELGFPTSIYVDYEQQTADEEFEMRAEGLVSLGL